MEHPAHPILKASILERSLFFVILPFSVSNGDVGIRTVSADISRDEITHVGVHSLVARELNENAGQSLNKLRRATALWIFVQAWFKARTNGWIKISGCVRVIIFLLVAKLKSLTTHSALVCHLSLKPRTQIYLLTVGENTQSSI